MTWRTTSEAGRLHSRHSARKQTAEYIERTLNRLTFGGGVYLATICVIPSVTASLMNVPFFFGGTGLLIVVGVALDTVQQIEQHLISRNYEASRPAWPAYSRPVEGDGVRAA